MTEVYVQDLRKGSRFNGAVIGEMKITHSNSGMDTVTVFDQDGDFLFQGWAWTRLDGVSSYEFEGDS